MDLTLGQNSWLRGMAQQYEETLSRGLPEYDRYCILKLHLFPLVVFIMESFESPVHLNEGMFQSFI